MKGKLDTIFLTIVTLLVIGGFFIFISASLGLLTREGVSLSRVALSQLVFGVGLGTCALFLFSRFHYRNLRKYAFYIFCGALALTAAVFIPGIGVESGGATRWLSVFGFSFQPAEVLKLAFVIYTATWLSGVRERLHDYRYGVVPFLILIGICSALLLAQPDTGTLIVIGLSGMAMYLTAGMRVRDIGIVALVGLIALLSLATLRPYVMDRLLTFLNPASDPLGAGYQIQQSLIAIGSGEVFGRGFGQSVQKFNFLPEPISDSIFALYAEEFGFLGAILLIGLFLAFALRGLRIAARAPDYFGGLLVVGLVTLIVGQSFLNIGSMLGVMPLTGMPLIFVSHGGSALLFALLETGIILNVSRYTPT